MIILGSYFTYLSIKYIIFNRRYAMEYIKDKNGKNYIIKSLNPNEINKMLEFQAHVIEGMSRAEFFFPLKYDDFLYPIIHDGGVFYVEDEGKIIAFVVLILDPLNAVLEEYKLDSDNIAVLDSIMVDEKYRGNKFQKQLEEYITKLAVKNKNKALVATVHPDNIYSLNNLLNDGYKIINKINIYNGQRYIVFKNL